MKDHRVRKSGHLRRIGVGRLESSELANVVIGRASIRELRPSSPRLAAGTEERAALGLNDALDDPLATRATRFSGTGIHAMMILVSAGLIERVAVGAIGER